MTITDIIEAVSKENGISKAQASGVVKEILKTMKSVLERVEKLKISSFGSFTLGDKKARIGRNPKTGEAITISARRVVTFKASPVLKERMNS